tara:strand:- start:9 stop:503 length:495 start_codon:yes stop_codon:yes gene_type:complete
MRITISSAITFLVLIATEVLATEQIEDMLELDGSSFDIDELPLESYPNQSVLMQGIDRNRCSASWRGYKAIWAIDNGKLSLSQLIKNPCRETIDWFDSKTIPDIYNTNGVATWYTGTISFRISPVNQLTQEKDGEQGMEYEAVVYRIQSGYVLTRSVEMIKRLW